jgi:hypothetical protein
MEKVSLVRSSIFGEESRSTNLARELVACLPHGSLVKRVFTADLMPYLMTSVLRRIPLLMLAIALTVSTSSSCQAIGSFQTRPAFLSVARSDDPPQPPTIAWPDASASALLGGCGRGRVSDPQTHGCRGPADIRSMAP